MALLDFITPLLKVGGRAHVGIGRRGFAGPPAHLLLKQLALLDFPQAVLGLPRQRPVQALLVLQLVAAGGEAVSPVIGVGFQKTPAVVAKPPQPFLHGGVVLVLDQGFGAQAHHFAVAGRGAPGVIVGQVAEGGARRWAWAVVGRYRLVVEVLGFAA